MYQVYDLSNRIYFDQWLSHSQERNIRILQRSINKVSGKESEGASISNHYAVIFKSLIHITKIGNATLWIS